jgi:hypothetical protein
LPPEKQEQIRERWNEKNQAKSESAPSAKAPETTGK